MKILFLSLLLSFLCCSCQSNQQLDSQEIYTYLEICFEDFYKNYNTDVKAELKKFEETLLKEGHLKDTTGRGYKRMLRGLDSSLYFNPPLKMVDFNSTVLYKSPSNTFSCATEVFSIDSSAILQTHFAKISKQIQDKVLHNKEISIHYFFRLYGKELTNHEIVSPYIKQNLLLLLYRWYFTSKYSRNIPIPKENIIQNGNTFVQKDSINYEK